MRDMKKCSILGVEIAEVNMERLVSYTEHNLSDLSGKYYCFANVHTTVTANENEALMRAYENAELIMPDGGPLSTVARKRGLRGIERTTGPSFMEEMLQRGHRHFFYGSTKETLAKMNEVINKRFRNATIAGMYSPPFRRMTEHEKQRSIHLINESAPDFVWVGLGAPKQELWMAEQRGSIRGLMCGVGAAFDYLAGNTRRAPEWMQRNNMEWLYRLKQEPKRLIGRYARTNTKFIWNAVILGK